METMGYSATSCYPMESTIKASSSLPAYIAAKLGMARFAFAATDNTCSEFSFFSLSSSFVESCSPRIDTKNSHDGVPALSQSFINKCCRNRTKSLNLCRKSVFNATNSNKPWGRTVSNLRLLISPAAIRRLIVTVCINTIKGKFWVRLLTHILKEVHKSSLRIIPPFAYFYTASTIMFVVYIFNVVAPRPHSSPAIVFWLIFYVPTMAVIGVSTPRKTAHSGNIITFLRSV